MQAGTIEVKFHGRQSKASGHPYFPGFQPGKEVLRKGSIIREGALALPCDILKERDTAVKLRDGTNIYVDVLRPAGVSSEHPTIISWTPFGKNEGFNRAKIVDDAPWRRGIPQRSVSSLEAFEAVDPAYWCNHGYAVVHPDIRGTWTSEGNMMMNCEQEGRDGYDLVEWVAQQPWSNQRVTFAGNSWLSQAQWFIAAENPPHLTCICPYEGWSDMYNDNTNRGGIPDPGFQAWLLENSCAGNQLSEDVGAMCYQYPMWNEYYEQRAAKLENIKVPMYVTASWTNALHTRGTFRGFMQSTACKEKWLRVHNSHEWPNLYYPENVEDHRRFCDYYMKDVSNGWEFTPPLRLSILNPGHKDVVNRPGSAFPLPSQQSIKMYLDGSNASLSWNKPIATAHHKFTISGTDEIATFTYTFMERTEQTGFFSLKLFLSSETSAEDIDVFCKTSKLSTSDELLESCCIDVGYLMGEPDKHRAELLSRHAENDPTIDSGWFAEGTTGRLRISHRELDTETSTPHWPRYTHSNYLPLQPGQIVPVEIELWPLGMIWEAGEKLKLSIAGFNLRPEILPMLSATPTCNAKGSRITFHTGTNYDSYLLVPYISP